MYEFDSRIRYSEVDAEGWLTWLALMDYFQDCSVFHSEEVGLGVEYLKEHHIAWVLNAWQIHRDCLPKLAQTVTVQTWAYGFKGLYGFRNFTMNDKTGRPLAYADSTWVLIDTITGRPVRVPEAVGQAYGVGERLPMEAKGRKIAVPKTYEIGETITVPTYFIDTNHHVNNSRYVQVAWNYVREPEKVADIRVEYKKAAVLGDVIVPHVTNGEDMTTVVLCSPESEVYAIVEFR